MNTDDNRRRRRGRGRSQHPMGKILSSTCASADIKMRGTVYQIIEKYESLARDEEDSLTKQTLLQHVEHYTRVKADMMEQESV